MRARLVRLLWVFALLFAVVVSCRFFVCDVYRIGSGSMRPTLFGGRAPGGGTEFGESVLVRFGGADDLERFDLVVWRLSAKGAPMVKRVAGLPGEAVGVREGDLVVDGKRLPAGAPRPAPVPVFDDRYLDVRSYFEFKDGSDGPWSFEGGVCRLDAEEVAHGSDGGMMLFHKDLRDDYLDQNNERVVGRVEANDAVIECEARLVELAGTLRLRLVEAGDTFEALIEAQTDGRVFGTLTRFNAETLQGQDVSRFKVAKLDGSEIAFEAGRWHLLRFSNVDNALRLELDGRTVLAVEYEANFVHPAVTGTDRKSVGARAAFGGEVCRAEFRSIRLSRDLYYTSEGDYGVAEPIRLGPDEFFLLGDNSAESRDSRYTGPVRADQILGRPVLVVWPPGRVRRLRGTADESPSMGP